MNDDLWLAEEIEREKARFCMVTGQSAEFYDNMTLWQKNAWVEESNKLQKERS